MIQKIADPGKRAYQATALIDVHCLDALVGALEESAYQLIGSGQ